MRPPLPLFRGIQFPLVEDAVYYLDKSVQALSGDVRNGFAEADVFPNGDAPLENDFSAIDDFRDEMDGEPDLVEFAVRHGPKNAVGSSVTG